MLLLFILKNTVRHIYQHYILRHGCCGVWSGVRKVVEMWELGTAQTLTALTARVAHVPLLRCVIRI